MEHTFSGARALRRSQTMMIGEASSSEDVTSRVAYATNISQSFVKWAFTHVIRMPSNIAHSTTTTAGLISARTTTISQGNNLSLAPKVPYDGVTGTARCR